MGLSQRLHPLNNLFLLLQLAGLDNHKVPPKVAPFLLVSNFHKRGHLGGNYYGMKMVLLYPWLEIHNLAQNSIRKGENIITFWYPIKFTGSLLHHKVKIITHLCTLIVTILPSHIHSRCAVWIPRHMIVQAKLRAHVVLWIWLLALTGRLRILPTIHTWISAHLN